MTNDEVKASLHYEARELGAAEAKTKRQKACANELVAEGKFRKRGTMSNGGEWFAMTEEYATKLRADGFAVVPQK